MGKLRSDRSSRSEERFKGWTSFVVTLALVLGVAGLTAGASAATDAGARMKGIEGASALQRAAVAEQAPLAALRSAYAAKTHRTMRLTSVRPTLRMLSTTAGVKRYLRTIGMNPAGVVIQRGRLNYAGPNCPGKAWTCTRSRKVVQIAHAATTVRSLAGRNAAQAQNRVECNPNGTVIDPAAGLPPGADCFIVQLTPPSGDNVASCILEFTTPAVTQGCGITQFNANGRNRATIREVARQTGVPAQPFGSFDQVTIQDVILNQYNGQGKNIAQITQAIDQRIMSGLQATPPENVIGAADGITLYQQGNGGNSADVNQGYGQNIQNLGLHPGDIEVGIQDVTASQCGAASADSCDQGSAKQTLHLNQSFSQALNAPQAVDGFQGQAAGSLTEENCPNGGGTAICGVLEQHSGGVSTTDVHQTGLQRAAAPKTSLVAEHQNDPFRCCTGDPLAQGANPNDHFDLTQDRTQLANSNIYIQLADSMEGSCLTSGNCTARQRANENGAVTLNSCTGSGCDIFITCPSTGAACTASSAPPPTPLMRRRR